MAVCFYHPTLCFYLTHLLIFCFLSCLLLDQWNGFIYLFFNLWSNTWLSPSSSIWIFRKARLGGSVLFVVSLLSVIPTNANIASQIFVLKKLSPPLLFPQGPLEGRPQPREFSVAFGWSCRICDSGIPAICSWFVGVNESVWGGLSGGIRLILRCIPPWNAY